MFRRPLTVPLIVAATLVLFSACDPDDDDLPEVNPTIVFVSDTGYTYQSDTVPTEDTLRVGVVINKGDDALNTFMLQVSYDGSSTATTTDSLPIGSDTFEFDKTLITRTQAGVERWVFVVVENDGDVIKRALTFTVEE